MLAARAECAAQHLPESAHGLRALRGGALAEHETEGPGDDRFVRAYRCARGPTGVRKRHRTCLVPTVATRNERAMIMQTDALFEKYVHDHLPAARSAIGEVVAVCREGELGYAEAAKNVSDGALRELFQLLADQRHTFADVLEQHAIWLGGAPEQEPRLSGWIHRKWLDLRASIEHGSAVTMLAECERGEHAALTKYERALGIPMPEALRGILLEQVAEIRSAHDRLDRMRGR